MNPPRDAMHLLPLLLRDRWFAALPESLRLALMQLAQSRRLAAGERLFSRGDANAGLYCVVEGAIRVGAIGGGGKEALLSVIEAPHWFGELALFDDGPRTHDADARVATHLLLVPRDGLFGLLQAEPQLWRHLGALAVAKMRALFGGLEDLSLLPAPARIARRLLAMAAGHGMLTPGMTRRVVAVNQEQLGAMLALTRQTVSQVLKTFERQGWVALRYGEIEISDWSALEALGEGASMV